MVENTFTDFHEIFPVSPGVIMWLFSHASMTLIFGRSEQNPNPCDETVCLFRQCTWSHTVAALYAILYSVKMLSADILEFLCFANVGQKVRESSKVE